MATFKVALVGPSQSGKSTFARLRTGEQLYEPTIGVEIGDIVLETNRGEIRLSVWDSASLDSYSVIEDANYLQAHAVIVCVEGGDFAAARKYIANARRAISPDTKFFCVLNKSDIHSVSQKRIDSFVARTGVRTEQVCSKTRYNCVVPFLMLARDLTGDKQLHLV